MTGIPSNRTLTLTQILSTPAKSTWTGVTKDLDAGTYRIELRATTIGHSIPRQCRICSKSQTRLKAGPMPWDEPWSKAAPARLACYVTPEAAAVTHLIDDRFDTEQRPAGRDQLLHQLIIHSNLSA